MTALQIKICGVSTAEDAQACVDLGADMLGFNFYPRSPRYVEPTAVRRIVKMLPVGICAVSVFVDETTPEIRRAAKAAGISSVQLHGNISPDSCQELARDFRVIRALCTNERFHPANVRAFSDCDILLDAHHPTLHGGTGRLCDWSAARATLPFARFLILSGGLNAQNVRRAIATVTPHAVDVCSGIESAPGVKDHAAIRDFIAAVRAAERSLHTTSA
jgi:phosphoribosylanthranilate isomerase